MLISLWRELIAEKKIAQHEITQPGQKLILQN